MRSSRVGKNITTAREIFSNESYDPNDFFYAFLGTSFENGNPISSIIRAVLTVVVCFVPSPSPKSASTVQFPSIFFDLCCVALRLYFRFVDKMSKLSENAPESFAINEASEYEKQQHYVGFDEKSCSGRLQRKHSFRLWHIILFLFVVAAIIVLVILLSPGVLRGKKAAASNGRKYNKHFNNPPHKLS